MLLTFFGNFRIFGVSHFVFPIMAKDVGVGSWNFCFVLPDYRFNYFIASNSFWIRPEFRGRNNLYIEWNYDTINYVF